MWDPAQSVSQPHPQRWAILAAVMGITLLGPVDSSVVNVALPTIASVFRADLGSAAWISIIYLLILGSSILTYGRLGDIYGFRRIFLTGVSIFTLASLLCSLSFNLWFLIGFRALQALGAGMFMSVGPAIITQLFPSQERGKALGFNATAVALGLALGPPLGGSYYNRWAGGPFFG